MSEDLKNRRALTNTVPRINQVSNGFRSERATDDPRCPKSATNHEQLASEQEHTDLEDGKTDRHRVGHTRAIALHAVRRGFAVGGDNYQAYEEERGDCHSRVETFS
ncbi:MAG: hypothetical protein JJE13_00355 [Thermoleophilia bacterium]|nr:hypothetical protein [Thermoleophilia bacterium]